MTTTNQKTVDPELQSLIAEAIAAGLLKAETEDGRIASIVARKGQGQLSPTERAVWEARVLPILAKPLPQTIALDATSH